MSSTRGDASMPSAAGEDEPGGLAERGNRRRGRVWRVIRHPGASFRHDYTIEDHKRVREALFYESDPRWRFRYGSMLTLSVTIAVMGLSADSSAVVIGAMLVAPLMTPVLGVAHAISHGSGRRLARAATTVLLSTLGALAIAAGLAAVLPDQPLSGEVLDRASPDGRDLLVAIAAGAAGAYTTLRQDVSSALPGVAVAVALVPPLGAAGIAFEDGARSLDLARGALLLYAANLTAIVVSGIIVMLASGFVSWRRLLRVRNRVGVYSALAGIGFVAVGLLLFRASIDATRTAQTQQLVREHTQTWLAETGLEIADIGLDIPRSSVTVDVVGPAEPPRTADLATSLAPTLGEEVQVTVRWSQRSTRTARDDPPPPTDEELALSEARTVVDRWLTEDERPYEVIGMELQDALLLVDLIGPTPPPSVEQLQALLASELAIHYTVELRLTERSSFPSGNEEPALPTDADIAALVLQAHADADPGYEIDTVQVLDGVILVDLVGVTPPTSPDVLVADLHRVFGSERPVEIRFSQRTVIAATDR